MLSLVWACQEKKSLKTIMDQQLVKITNDNIRKAVSLWCSDREAAIEIYGFIEEWDTSAVTDMRCVFSEKKK